jgi:calcineurin-like phosphoesterase family protein
MTIFFTSDTHFNHARMLTVEKDPRPFTTVEEMNEVIIERWNARVTNSDLVYHLGDFTLNGEHDPFLQRLNGHKFLILGNHDTKQRIKRATLWEGVYETKYLKTPGARVILFHYALRTWRNSHYGNLHFYGHSHGHLPGDSQSLDVGVDCWGYQPVTLEEIKERLETLPKRAELDHHQPRESNEDC